MVQTIVEVAAFHVESLLVSMFHHHRPTMIVIHQVLFNPGKSLVTAMTSLFFHDDNNCWRQKKQLVMSSVGGRCCYMLERGSSGYDTEPMLDRQAQN
jgi:hypothetical protein